MCIQHNNMSISWEHNNTQHIFSFRGFAHSVPSRFIVAAKEIVSINKVAIRKIKVLYNKFIDVGCFLTVDDVGERIHQHSMISARSELICSPEVPNFVCYGGVTLDCLFLRIAPPSDGVDLKPSISSCPMMISFLLLLASFCKFWTTPTLVSLKKFRSSLIQCNHF